MRCPHCGFIRNIDFDECPYCGHIMGNKKFLNKRVSLNKRSSIKLSTLLTVVSINLFLVLLIVDIITQFKYFFILIAYVVMIFSIILFHLLDRKRSVIMVMENLDFCFITSLILFTVLLPVYYLHNSGFANAWNSSTALSHINPGSLFAFLIVPSFLLVASILIAAVLILKKEKFRPLITGSIFNFHFLISLILFILLMIARDNEGVASYVILYENTTNDWLTIFEYSVVSLSFVINALIFINFNAILIGSIISHAGTVYGKDKKD
ncbi:MAG: hypothetical protein MJ213_03125 [Bacilli bacterium]|nr:hypothetical protein [Bacilli bacterium]